MEDLADVAFGSLPQDPPVQFDRPALAAVVFELRFAGDAANVTAEHASRIQALLPIPVERVEPAEQHLVGVAVGPDGPVSSEASILAKGWQLSTLDGSTAFTVMPGVASVQLNSYERWSESLRPLVEGLLGALDEVLRPSLAQRSGLRYINRFAGDAATKPNDWVGRISDTLLGPIANPVLGPLVSGVHQEVHLRLEPGVGALIRHGILAPQPGHPAAYLVDLDTFVERAAPFDADALLVQATRLNRTANSLFRFTVTRGQLDEMGPSPIEKHSGEECAP